MAKGKFTAPKGMRDIMPEEAALFRHVEETFRETCRLFGYREIRTPHMEATDLFCRTVGETTDIVEKEMYTLTTKGGDELALRPENTAGVVRAYLEHGMHRSAPLQKFFYWGEMFRHEAKQKKRYREFTQAGVECFGVKEAEADVEVIALAVDFFRTLGLGDVRVELSTFGCAECRAPFRDVLVEFFSRKGQALCRDCKQRLERNVFRLLDCKEESCRRLVADAPTIDRFLDEGCRTHFADVLRGLETVGVASERNSRLVRGLDYYNGTIFEVFPAGAAGRQDALGAGGRYDGLAGLLGGPRVPAVGFALGVDRIVLELECPEFGKRERIVYVAGFFLKEEDPSKATAEQRSEIKQRGQTALKYAVQLRRAGVACIHDTEVRRVGKQVTAADKAGADFALLFGGDELRAGNAVRKNMKTGEQRPVPLENIVSEIQTELQAQPEEN